MLLTVISVNLNNYEGLKRTIASVKSQSIKSFEYIVIDGGSTDRSMHLIKENSQIITFWMSERDTGIYNAMNKGIAKASGNYLIFLNSGDCFSDSDTLRKCYNFIDLKPGADVYYADIFVVNDKNRPEKWKRTHPEPLSLKFFKYDTINHQASLIKSELFREFSFYPENYKVASDYWFFLKCFLNNKKYIHLGFPMIDYDLTGISYSNYESYKLEKQNIWNSLVPLSIQQTTDECEEYKSKLLELKSYRMISAAINLNKKYQKLKITLKCRLFSTISK